MFNLFVHLSVTCRCNLALFMCYFRDNKSNWVKIVIFLWHLFIGTFYYPSDLKLGKSIILLFSGCPLLNNCYSAFANMSSQMSTSTLVLPLLIGQLIRLVNGSQVPVSKGYFCLCFVVNKLQWVTKVVDTLLESDAFWYWSTCSSLFASRVNSLITLPPSAMLCRCCDLCCLRNRKINIV